MILKGECKLYALLVWNICTLASNRNWRCCYINGTYKFNSLPICYFMFASNGFSEDGGREGSIEIIG